MSNSSIFCASLEFFSTFLCLTWGVSFSPFFCKKNWNFSAVWSLIRLKLGGDLRLVSQISLHVLVLRFVCFLYSKQTKEQKKRQNCENRGFTKLAFSLPCRVWLIWNLVGTSRQVLGIVWYVCFVYIIVCLHFVNVNKENTLLDLSDVSSSNVLKPGGCLHPFLTHNSVETVFLIHRLSIWRHFEKTLKGHQYGYLLKGLGLRSKNMLLVFRFSCLFTFRKHKQPFGAILKNR
jgi:hypothetical protein